MFCGQNVRLPFDNDQDNKNRKGLLNEKRSCCATENLVGSFGDCNDVNRPAGVAHDAILIFAQYEGAWLVAYREAW
jgi:hypothetical protein